MAATKSWECKVFPHVRAHNRGLLPFEQEYEHKQKQENEMIARIWHGWTKAQDAKAYEEMLRDEIFPGIARRNIEGYNGAELFIRDDGDEVEFVTLLRFDSMKAVKEFAGEDQRKPVIYPKAEVLLTRMDQYSQHYRIVISGEKL